MDLEVRSLPADQSRPLQAKVKEYKADIASLKSQTQKVASALPAGDAARAELVSASSKMLGPCFGLPYRQRTNSAMDYFSGPWRRLCIFFSRAKRQDVNGNTAA